MYSIKCRSCAALNMTRKLDVPSPHTTTDARDPHRPRSGSSRCFFRPLQTSFMLRTPSPLASRQRKASWSKRNSTPCCHVVLFCIRTSLRVSHSISCHVVQYGNMTYLMIRYESITTAFCHDVSHIIMLYKTTVVTPCHDITLCNTFQYRATPRHATPRHATPRHAAPRHATPRHATPRHATPHHTTPHRTTRFCTVPCRSVPYRTVLHDAIMYRTAPITLAFSTALSGCTMRTSWITLHCAASHEPPCPLQTRA